MFKKTSDNQRFCTRKVIIQGQMTYLLLRSKCRKNLTRVGGTRSDGDSPVTQNSVSVLTEDITRLKRGSDVDEDCGCTNPILSFTFLVRKVIDLVNVRPQTKHTHSLPVKDRERKYPFPDDSTETTPRRRGLPPTSRERSREDRLDEGNTREIRVTSNNNHREYFTNVCRRDNGPGVNLGPFVSGNG